MNGMAKRSPSPSPKPSRGKGSDSPNPEATQGNGDTSPSPSPGEKNGSGGDPGPDLLGDPIGWIIAHPAIAAIALLILVTAAAWGARRGWSRLTLRANMRGRGLQPLGVIIRRSLRLMLKEDKYPVLAKPKGLAAKMTNYTWTRHWRVLFSFTGVFLVASIWVHGSFTLYIAAVLAVLWFLGIRHIRMVSGGRHRILMQMFEVASGEMRYPRGSELNPWGYVIITGWLDLYTPDVTHVMYPAKYRSEDVRNREAFELNFAGTVSDQYTWTYEWESSNNRVVCTPVPFITTSAPYPFPDQHPWNVIPLGIGAGGKEVSYSVSDFPHLLIAGTTGSGKSVTQRTLLLHVLQHKDWRVCLIDPKRVELAAYRGHPNVLRVATELDESVALIEQIEQEMQSRYIRMQEEGKNFFKSMDDPPPAVLLMVDETFALLSPENIKSDEGKERDELHARAATLLGSIARLGRASGVHMVLATQRPDAKVIPGETKPLWVGTPVLTAAGWTTVEELKVGDVLFDDAGQPTTIVKVTPTMHGRACQELVFSDGSSVVADDEHVWVFVEEDGARFAMSTAEAADALASGGEELWLPQVTGLSGGEQARLGRVRLEAVHTTSTVPVRCVAVDGPTQLFLVGRGCVATHNSNLDARIAQGRMDTIPSQMTLDSDYATRIPKVKGRAVLRTGNDFTEFQAYFLQPEHLPQVLEMSAALATGKVGTDFFLEANKGKEGEREGGRRLPFKMPKIPLPAGLVARFRTWVAKRKAVMEENELRAGRTEETRGQRKKLRDGKKGKGNSLPSDEETLDGQAHRGRSEPSVQEVAAAAVARGTPVDAPDLFDGVPGEPHHAAQDSPPRQPPGSRFDDPAEDDEDEESDDALDEEFWRSVGLTHEGPVGADPVVGVDPVTGLPLDPAVSPVPNPPLPADEVAAPPASFGSPTESAPIAPLPTLSPPVLPPTPVPPTPVPPTPIPSVSVAKVLQRARDRGVPVSASELLAALQRDAALDTDSDASASVPGAGDIASVSGTSPSPLAPGPHADLPPEVLSTPQASPGDAPWMPRDTALPPLGGPTPFGSPGIPKQAAGTASADINDAPSPDGISGAPTRPAAATAEDEQGDSEPEGFPALAVGYHEEAFADIVGPDNEDSPALAAPHDGDDPFGITAQESPPGPRRPR